MDLNLFGLLYVESQIVFAAYFQPLSLAEQHVLFDLVKNLNKFYWI